MKEPKLKLKTKPKMGVPKVLDKARNLSRSMRNAAQRAKDKASIDSDEYASPSEYAEHEISEIINDGVTASRKTASKAATSAKKRIRRSIDKRRAKKQLSQEQSIDTANDIEVCEPCSAEEAPKPKTNGKRGRKPNNESGKQSKAHGKSISKQSDARSSFGSKSDQPSKPVSNTRSRRSTENQAYSESARTASPMRVTMRPKVAPKNTASTVKQAPARTLKTTSRTVNTTGKTVKATERAVVKTAEATKQTAQKTAQASKFAAQKAAAAARVTAKVVAKAAQLTVKGAVAVGKGIAAGVKWLVAAITAGGWVAVVIIAGIIMIAAIVCTGFGIFFSNDGGGRSISEVIPTIERQFNSRITYDINQIPLGRHSAKKTVYVGDDDGDAPVNNWNDVIAVFSVLATTRDEDPMDVVVLTEDAEALLGNVYNRMNSYTITTGSSGEG
ncbi:MAG: hypothetical protein IKZ82_04670, partial [Clostridia bacterium]|nr:hypothetical protein [Clostridia bacterium]